MLILWKKLVILRLAGTFSLLIDNIRCGYARFKGAGRTFSEHQKNRQTIDKSMRKLNFSAWPWKNQLKCKYPIISKGFCTVIHPHSMNFQSKFMYLAKFP